METAAIILFGFAIFGSIFLLVFHIQERRQRHKESK